MPEKPGEQDLVSWLDKPLNAPSDSWKPIPTYQSITYVGKSYIELDLLLFRQNPAKPSAKALLAAAQLIETHQLRALSHKIALVDSVFTKDFMQDILFDEYGSVVVSAFVQTMLAFALDNGLDWVQRFPDTISESWEMSSIAGNLADNDEDLKESAVDLLCHLGKDPTDASLIKVTKCFLLCIMDNRLKSLTLSPRRVQMREDDWCLTELTTNSSWIAVPVAAAHLPYSSKRAWVLEAFDPSISPETLEDSYTFGPVHNKQPEVGHQMPVLSSDYETSRSPLERVGRSWRLRKRQVIFGCRTIAADDANVIHLSQQRVYGAEKYNWTRLLEVSRATLHNEFG